MKTTGTPTSVAEVLSTRLMERPRRTLMDGDLYEALNAARRAAEQPATVSLSPQAQARLAVAAGAVPAAAHEDTKTGEKSPHRDPTPKPAIEKVAHVDVKA